MNFIERLNTKGDKITFYYDYGRGAGQRPSTGVFIYAKPKTPIEKAHNKEALALLDVKKSEAIIDRQAIGTAYVPKHKFKENFFEYYEDYVKAHKVQGNRHLEGSLKNLRIFVGKDFLHPMTINENFCRNFRKHLLDRFNGETPANYYSRFRWVLNAATADGYFKANPTEKVFAKGNPSVEFKENLEVEEYIQLVNTPCGNQQVQLGFLFCCYTGLRWVDVKQMKWADINGSSLTTRIIQQKTGRPVVLTLHPIAQAILKRQELTAGAKQGDAPVFPLPSARGAGKALNNWIGNTSINKHITWSCARLSFSILLQDRKVDDATVACLLGHTTTEQVQKTYRRHRPKNEEDTIALLPSPEELPYYLHPDLM